MSFEIPTTATRKPITAISSVALVGMVAYLDYISGWEVSLFVFYALPILLAVWYGDFPTGIIIAGLSMVAWWWANEEGNPYETKGGYLWAAGSRFFYFVFVAIGGFALKKQRETDRARIAALEHARALERDIVDVSEHEQRRIGQDLHDGLCQVLAGIGCAVTMLKDDLMAKELAEAATAEEIEGYIRDAAAEARDLARGIFPVLKDAVGLEIALEELASVAQKLYHRKVTFSCSKEIHVSDPDAAMHLYRITQEALSNALKHAKAKEVRINLCELDSHILLSVEDDGLGIPEHASSASGGMGLRTMLYRSKQIGAELKVRRGEVSGTIVSCRMPLRSTSLTP